MIHRMPLLFITLLWIPFQSGCLPQVTTGDGTTYYQDDFSNPASGWDQTSGNDGATEYSAGQYRLYSALPNYLLWANPGRSFPADVVIEVSAEKKAGPDNNAFGILCRYQNTGNYYALIISSDGQAGIAKVQSGAGPTIISGGHMDPKDEILKGNSINQLRAECVGDSLKLYANDGLVASATDDAFLTSGDVGLWLCSYDDPGSEVFFDNFLVRHP